MKLRRIILDTDKGVSGYVVDQTGLVVKGRNPDDTKWTDASEQIEYIVGSIDMPDPRIDEYKPETFITELKVGYVPVIASEVQITTASLRIKSVEELAKGR